MSELEKYMTNTDKPVFVLLNLPEVVKGALFSRYSRSTKSLRKVLEEEFIDQLKEVNEQKAEEFYERVLVGYGDDSIAELGGVHVAIEEVSIIATKELEDARIGISPLEKSTRYVYFDQKREDGTWPYHREKKLMEEFPDEYTEACDFAFSRYAELIPKINKYMEEKFPKEEGTSERAYKSTIRAKTCDVLRGLLPAATLTNMGFYGNGRAYEYLLTKMYASPLDEVKNLATMMHEELSKVIPSFVKRANNRYGKEMQQYLKTRLENMEKIRYKVGESGEYVRLMEYDRNAIDKIVEAIIFPHSGESYREIKERVKNMDEDEKKKIIDAYVGVRKNRRHRPGRAFEQAYYLFDICANYGAYRDLHRHRILTQQRQTLTPYYGYKMPKEIVDAGYESEFKEVLEVAKNNYEKMKKYPYQAQYVVPLAYNIKWYMKFNLREAYHLIELRSMRQGHPDYRKIVQSMYLQIKEKNPELVEKMMVDMSEYDLERLEAEKKIDKKLEELKKKYG